MAKICMIAYTFYKSDPRVRREAEALVERGDEVDFICVQDAAQSAGDELQGVRLYPLRAGRYQGGSTARYLIQYASFFLQSFFLVAFLFFRKRYDIIHVHTMPDFLVFSALIPRLFGAKVVLDVHDLMPELYICKFKKSDSWIIRFITWIEVRSIAFAHRAVAVHIPHRNALVEHGNPLDKFTVLMNVPDPRVFGKALNEHRPSEKFRLIYHGTVARRHGLEMAVRAIDMIRDEVSNLEFLVLGHGDDLARIKRLVMERGLEKIVRFEGRVAVDELPRFLQNTDLGLVPLLYDEFTRYMLPLKLMEYVYLGIPSIVSRTDTIQTYFDDEMVRFVPPGDHRALASAILDLYGHPELRTKMASAANGFNSRYNWEMQKLALFDMVDSLVPVSERKLNPEIVLK